jgi:hypothetical protein
MFRCAASADVVVDGGATLGMWLPNDDAKLFAPSRE